jgi:hypothetical protein
MRIDANRNNAPLLAVIMNAGVNPAGISIDNLGKPWTSAISSNEAVRINPVTNVVDVDSNNNPVRTSLGASASAYNYGDMTGTFGGAAVVAAVAGVNAVAGVTVAVDVAFVTAVIAGSVEAVVAVIVAVSVFSADPAVVCAYVPWKCVWCFIRRCRHCRHWFHHSSEGELASDAR